MKIALSLLFCLAASALAEESSGGLKPLMAMPDRIVLDHDFSKPAPLSKAEWAPRQGTRWSIEGGRLLGQPSTAEYQAKKKDHKGLEARVSVPKTPAQFVAKFSIRFLEGEENAIVPFVEFGHHVCRIKFTRKDGTFILADGESVRVAEAGDFDYEPGKWYHALAELKGEEFVIQFAGGPTLYARHECFAKPNPGGGNGLGIAGTRGGNVEVDDVTIRSIKEDLQPGWPDRRAAFPKFKPVPAGKVKKVKS